MKLTIAPLCCLVVGILLLAASPVLAGGEGLVPFEDIRPQEMRESDPTDQGKEGAMLHLYRQHYDKPDVGHTDLRFDAFLTYQATVSEFHIDREGHDSILKEYTERVQEGAEKPNLYYISTWGASNRPMFDGNGQIYASRRSMTSEEMRMRGRLMYFPSDESLDRIYDITLKTQEAASGLSDPPEDSQMDDFLKLKEELEKQLLQIIAGELGKMKELAGNKDVYGMGYVYKEDETMEPLRLDMDHLEKFMKDKGLKIERPQSSGPEETDDLAQPVLSVTQPPAVQQELDGVYRKFANGFETETERTLAEMKHGPFRLRILPGENVKIYDPIATFELQHGGLSLPSYIPDEE